MDERQPPYRGYWHGSLSDGVKLFQGKEHMGRFQSPGLLKAAEDDVHEMREMAAFLRDALSTYGRHLDDCALLDAESSGIGFDCSCGLDATLKTK